MCIEPPRPPEVPSTRPKSSAITRFGIGSACDRVAVGAVGADQVVVRPHHRGRADDRRLLTDRQVEEAAGLGALVLPPGLLLEAPDQDHQGEQLAAGRLVRELRLARRRLAVGRSGRPSRRLRLALGHGLSLLPGLGPVEISLRRSSGRPAQGVHFAASVPPMWHAAEAESSRRRPCRRAGSDRRRQPGAGRAAYRGRDRLELPARSVEALGDRDLTGRVKPFAYGVARPLASDS